MTFLCSLDFFFKYYKQKLSLVVFFEGVLWDRNAEIQLPYSAALKMRSCKHKHLQNRFTTNMLASSTHCTGLHIALFVCFNKQQNVHKHLTRLPRFTKSKNVCVVEVCTSCFACQQQGWSVYGCLCVCVCVRERECV